MLVSPKVAYERVDFLIVSASGICARSVLMCCVLCRVLWPEHCVCFVSLCFVVLCVNVFCCVLCCFAALCYILLNYVFLCDVVLCFVLHFVCLRFSCYNKMARPTK